MKDDFSRAKTEMATQIKMWEILTEPKTRGFRLSGVIMAPPPGTKPGDCWAWVETTIVSSLIPNLGRFASANEYLSSLKEGDVVLTRSGQGYELRGPSREDVIEDLINQARSQLSGVHAMQVVYLRISDDILGPDDWTIVRAVFNLGTITESEVIQEGVYDDPDVVGMSYEQLSEWTNLTGTHLGVYNEISNSATGRWEMMLGPADILDLEYESF